MRTLLACAPTRLTVILLVGMLMLGFQAQSVEAYNDGDRAAPQRGAWASSSASSLPMSSASSNDPVDDLGMPAWAKPQSGSTRSIGVSSSTPDADSPPDFPGPAPVPVDDHIYLLIIAGIAYAAVRLSGRTGPEVLGAIR